MPNRIIIPDPSLNYYRVKLTETVGTGDTAVIIEGWVRHVWAKDRYEAASKALLFHMKRNKGSQPRLVAVELETYSRPIEI